MNFAGPLSKGVSEINSGDRIFIRLDGRGSCLYYPGDTLAGSYSLREVRHGVVDTIEVSVLWRTEGKGNEDVGVHAFWRLSSSKGDWIDLLQPGRFSVVLPESPLTYNGNLFRICWSVRLRVFLTDGRQLVEEKMFYLGDLPDWRTLKQKEKGRC